MLRTSCRMIEVVCSAIEVVVSAVEVVRGAIEIVCRPIEVVAVDDRCAMRDVGVVVVNDCPVSPITSPMVPAPAEAGDEADSKAYAKIYAWPCYVKSRILVPTRPGNDRNSIDDPRIICGDVDHLRFRGLDDDGVTLRLHSVLPNISGEPLGPFRVSGVQCGS